MKDFRQLKVWDKAHRLALAPYRSTVTFPPDERFGLTSQIRRCSSSVAANIAEACGRDGDGDFCRFLQVAMGSITELDYHWLLAHDLGFIEHAPYEAMVEQIVEVKSMLAPLIRKVQSDRKG